MDEGAARAQPSRPREIRRSRDDKVLAGVCSGIGRYFGVDPLLIRIGFVVLIFAGGGGILTYLICWLLIPEEGAPGSTPTSDGSESSRVIGVLAGSVLVTIGASMLIARAMPEVMRFVGPIVFIVTGVIILSLAGKRT